MNDQPGMEIVLVNSESPAWHAGLKHGDIVIEISGKKVNNIADYRQNMVEAVEHGSLEFKVLRKGTVKVLKVEFNQ